MAESIKRRLNNAMQEACLHYRTFGFHGLFLVVKARLWRRPVQVRFSVPGFPYALHLRLRTSDVALFREVLVDCQYDWELPVCPEVIVDAGANIGLTSVVYANRYPQARIVAIEPEASNFEMLKKNTSSYANITAVRAALWKENCELNILDPGDGLWDFWGFRTADPEKSEASKRGRVRGITLDELMKENCLDCLDLLKVDIEGAEKEVFERSTAWIDRVGAIAIELHDRFKEGCSDSVCAATKNFEVRWQRAETTFLLRRNIAASGSPQEGLMTKLQHSGQGRSILPLRIESAA
jgi:FkbM family methyltransferase